MYGTEDPRAEEYSHSQSACYPDQEATTCQVGFALMMTSAMSYMANHGLLVYDVRDRNRGRRP